MNNDLMSLHSSKYVHYIIFGFTVWIIKDECIAYVLCVLEGTNKWLYSNIYHDAICLRIVCNLETLGGKPLSSWDY